MKRILIAVNILLLGIIIFQASRSNNANAQQQLRLSLAPEAQKNIIDPSREGLIDYDVALKMTSDYRRDVGKGRISGTSGAGFGKYGKRDATAIWFSLEMLKNFLNKIDNSIPTTIPGRCRPMLGVRIYYAKYPANLSNYSCLKSLSPQVANHHTVFMVPTYRDSAMDVDFNIDHIGNNPCKPIPLAQLPDSAKLAVPILAFNSKNYIYQPVPPIFHLVIQNHGGLSPPPDNQGIFPTTPQHE